MARRSKFEVRSVAFAFGMVGATACGPGPLPAENPPLVLSPPPEPVPVQVDTTVPAAPAPVEALPAPKPELPVVAAASLGFKTPESILFDAASDVYLVSNINGSPSDADNNGFISVVNPDGTLRTLEFIAGGKQGVTLNAPKGMALHEGTLYVADITVVRKFDLKTGTSQGVIQFPGATFINDVVADTDGTLYVSDTGVKISGGNVTPTGTDAIFKVVKGKVKPFAKGASLTKPNGLTLLNGTLVAVTFGGKNLLQFDASGAIVATSELPAGSNDGVVVLPTGQLLVSSWEAKSVFVGTIGGTWSTLSTDLPAPADMGFDPGRNRVLVPLFMNDELRFLRTPTAESTADQSSPTAPASVSPTVAPAPH